VCPVHFLRTFINAALDRLDSGVPHIILNLDKLQRLVTLCAQMRLTKSIIRMSLTSLNILQAER
jgi:hypothetical protein